jgi:hypothetical protein
MHRNAVRLYLPVPHVGHRTCSAESSLDCSRQPNDRARSWRYPESVALYQPEDLDLLERTLMGVLSVGLPPS